MRLFRNWAMLPLSLAALCFSAQVEAAALAGIDALANWDLISFNNLNASGSVQGRSFVGGDLRSEGASFYATGATDPKSEVKEAGKVGELSGDGKSGSSSPALSVAGNVGGNLSIGNGGGASVGGNIDGGLTLSGAAQMINVGGEATRQDVGENTLNTGLGKDFTDTLLRQRELLMEGLTSLSGDVSKLEATARAEAKEGALILKASEGLNVFNLSIDELSKMDSISLVAADGSTTVINVSGDAGRIAAHFLDGSTELAHNVLWNFYEARDLVLDGEMFGTILANNAQIALSGYVAGSLIGSAIANSGTIQTSAFQGNLTQNAAPVPHQAPITEVVSAAPEPGVWLMLIGGFALVGAAMRRRAAGAAIPCR